MSPEEVWRPTLSPSFSYLVEVIHEHLPHLVHRNGGVDGTVQPQLAHGIGEGAEVQRVGV